jgi:hypothetical protein
VCYALIFIQTNLRLNSSTYKPKHARCKVYVITHVELSTKIRTLTETELCGVRTISVHTWWYHVPMFNLQKSRVI